MSSQKFRSFTIRVPTDLYLLLATTAQGDGVPLNQKANQLLRMGLGQHISLDEALRRLLINTISEGNVDAAPSS